LQNSPRPPTVGCVLPLRFAPYADTTEVPNVVVDGAANAATVLTLSHWPGSPTPRDLLEDLSAQIALRALDEPGRFATVDVVTNNHFDQDGLASVYALTSPDEARARRDQVVDVARAGDFGSFAHRDSARISFAIAAYDDPDVSPLGRDVFTKPYDEQCAIFYAELLPRFGDLLDHPDRWRSLWEQEDAHLGESIAAIEQGVVTVDERDDLDLAVVTVPEHWATRASHRFTQRWTEAVHPMAVDNATERTRILLVQGRSYRLELRYETWVMFVSRRVAPRPDLRDLARHLDTLEIDGAHWQAEPPGALTPRLSLAGTAESSLDPDRFRHEVEHFLATAAAAWDPFAAR
jgi:uncharacterized protein DUF6687